jgi:amino acid adenylation domain-containing protein
MKPVSETVCSLLSKAAAKFPENIAVKGTDFCFSFSEFEALSDGFAARLIQSGARKGELIGICLGRSAEMLIGIFGALKAGCAYVPADPDYPAERVKFVFDDASVRFVITTNQFIAKVEALGFIALVPETSYHDQNQVDFPEVLPSDLAYVLFTSGSTCKPKGVLFEHHSVINLCRSVQHDYPLAEGDTVLLKSPYTFDGSVWELYGWIEQGSTLYVAPRGVEKDPSALALLIQQQKISFAFFVSSMLSSFLDYAYSSGNHAMLQSLKWVSAGGEVVSPVLVQRFYKLLEGYGCRLINVYGPTETTVYATTFLCEPGVEYTKIPVGKTVANDYIYVLDEGGNLLTDGSEGEICIGGRGVARGYLNREDLTNERFVENPFRPGEKMYRTGDIGRLLPDGLLDFIGRRDFQVKLRGLRIELGEIENALYGLDFFKEVAVLFTKDRTGDDSIVACIVPEEHFLKPSESDYYLLKSGLREQISEGLQKTLPVFMLPSEFIVCRSFPVNENGKLDRKALPSVASLYIDETSGVFVPATETELKVYNIWKHVLSRETIGRDEDFFGAGGHSLKAIQVITAVIQNFGIELPLSVFYSGLTIPDMVQLIENEKGTHYKEIIQSTAGSTQNKYPLTGEQREMWVLNSMDESRIQHNILVEFTLSGQLDSEQLISNIKLLTQNEEIFRSIFPLENGVPVQQILDTAITHVEYTDLADYKDNTIAYQQIRDQAGRMIFNLNELPLFNFKLIRLGDQDFRLLLAIHHIIFDGWSLQLFTQTLAELYQPLSNSDEIPTKIRIGDYANWHNGFVEHVKEEQFKYWKSVFADIPAVLKISMRRNARRSLAGREGRRFWFWIPAKEAEQIEQFCASLKVTPFALFLSAYQMALSVWSGQRDVCIGTPFANRKHPAISSLIGYFTNMVAIRADIDPDKPFTDLVKACSNNSVNAFSNADLPFGQVVKSLGIQTKQGIHPLFQAMFIMQNWPAVQKSFPGFTLTQKELGNQTSKADFSLNVEKTGNAFECWLEYDTELFEVQLVEKITTDIRFLLNTICTEPVGSLRKIPGFYDQRSRMRTAGTCIVIGEGNITLHCIDVLQAQNFDVKSLVSNDFSLKPACNERSVLFLDSIINSAIEPVDFIFSINNSLLLTNEFLQNARKMAINYHDSPLPLYAGMFASNHAIANCEKQHGVSWHLMVDKIDAGAILESEAVPVTDEDTAWHLNTRCFEAAIRSFERLVTKLADNAVIPVEQDLSKRTYYGRLKRPSGLGTIHWTQTVEQIRALIRSTDFGGHYMNEFMLPHMLINDAFYTFENASFESETKAEPGTIIQTGKHVKIACSDGAIIIDDVFDQFNHVLHLDVLLSNLPDEKKMRLELPDHAFDLRVQELYSKLCRYESWWKTRLTEPNYIEWPFVSSGDERQYELKILLNLDLDFFRQTIGFKEDQLYYKALAMLYFLQLADTDAGIFGTVPKQLTKEIIGFESLFTLALPLAIGLKPGETVIESMRRIIDSYEEVTEKGTFMRDLPLRYPDLRDTASQFPQIVFINDTAEAGYISPASICVHVSPGQMLFSFPADNGTDAVAADAFEKSFTAFLTHATAWPSAKLNEIPLIADSVLNTVYGELNQTAHSFREYEDVMVLFEKVAAEYAGKPAVVSFDRVVDYAEFASDVKRMASILHSEGILPGDVVAVSLERSYAYYVSVLAALRCGAAFLPIDPSLPMQRKQFMLTDSDTVLMIGEDQELASYSAIKILLPGIYKSGISVIEFPTPTEPELLAYIIYTSGSTGVPKGVRISRKALSGFVRGAIDLYQVQQTDRILQFANLGFDASIEEIFCAFCTGASLYPRNEEMLMADVLINFTNDNQINFWDLPTAFWRQTINEISAGSLQLPISLKTVIIGGEAVNQVDVEVWDKITHQNCKLYNTYGPTETTVVAAAFVMSKGEVPVEAVPIGKPLQGYSLYVADRFHRIMPQCVKGELLIAGQSVADGYVKNDRKQNEVFIEVTLPGSATERCYCTGDIVILGSDHHVYYFGRADNQIKIRGFRVELSEIEMHLMNYTGISQCLVLYDGPEKLKAQLVAFVTGISPAEIPMLRSWLNVRLPAYMLPSVIVSLTAFPLTSNGKTDIKALWILAAQNTKNHAESETLPLNTTEEAMLEIWREVMGTKELGVQDDFFDAGGHSLKAVQLMAVIHKKLRVNLPLSSLITHPTVRKLSELIFTGKQGALWECLVPIRPGGSLTPLFLVHGAGLNVLLYQTLGRNLKPDRPIFALQAKGLDGKQKISGSIQEMASDYIGEIKKIHPNGPYLLFGFSLGGFIAYEMARQLIGRGEEVRFLGVIDTVTYAAHEDLPRSQYLIRQLKLLIIKPLFIIWMFLIEPWAAKGKYINNKFGNLKHELKYQLMKRGFANPKAKNEGPVNDDAIPVFQKAQVALTIYNALKTYTLQPASLVIDLFRAEKKAFYIPERKTYGWGRFAQKGVKVHNIPGEHSLIFAPPNDKLFAGILDARLDELETEATNSSV